MKHRITREISYFEIDPNFRLKLGSLFKLLQEAAISHSESVGMGAREVGKREVAWVLSKMGIDVFRYPFYQEKLEIVTWSTGLRGLKAFREFEVYAGGNKIAAVSSMWFLINTRLKKIQRIPPELIDIYSSEDAVSLERDMDTWRAETEFAPDKDIRITTRSADYDPNGHVNNSVYFEYVETLISKHFGDTAQVRALNMFFAKEINRKIEAVSAGLKEGSTNLFKIYDEQHLFASGDFTIEKGTL